MSSSRSRFFFKVAKQKQEEDSTIQKDSFASDDDGDDDAGTSLSRHIDSRSAVHLSIGNASDPLIIDEDSDSEIEVLPTQAELRSSPTDRVANDVKQGRDPVHGKARESHPALVASSLDQEPSLQDSIPSDQRKENPFSKFAFAGGSGGGLEIVSQPVPPTFSWSALNTPTARVRGDPASNKISAVSSSVVMEPPGLVISSNHGHPRKKKKTCEFIPMRSISKEEQDTITRKWHSLADPTAPLEVRRFQVLVAARLHARCQEPSVRKAMTVLREAFLPTNTTTTTTTTGEDDAGFLNVSAMARADPHVLALHLTNLQYYNIKAQHIVKAAKEIETEFKGVVPEDETSLLRLTGVGKVFADLLAFVNTREIHQRFRAVTPHDSSIAMDDTNRTP
jgi:endonuclease III